MCGVLLVCSSHEIDMTRHQRAMDLLRNRGPDFMRWQQRNNIFIAQSVLRITGSDNYYEQDHEDFLSYNGEIYNYKKFGAWDSDIDLVHEAVRRDHSLFAKFEGAWAWAWTDFNTVRFASDPQGERCLYRYQDRDILIICSDVAPILEYLDLSPRPWRYREKHWPVRSRTPWQGIERIVPGTVYDLTGTIGVIDSIFDWVKPASLRSMDEAWEEFQPLWSRVIKDMTPACDHGVTASGGLDSSVIFNSLPDAAHLYSVDCVGKDTISPLVPKMMTDWEQQKLITIQIDAKTWASQYIEIISSTKMPVQSWSFVGQWAIAQHCRESVLFTGVGADELFGGYACYATLPYTAHTSSSIYSKFDHDDQEALQQWQQCVAACDGDARPATLLMDFITQVSAVDMRGVDCLTMAHGIEPRSPFTHPSIIKFALALPWHLRLGKPLIRRLFLQRWSQDFIYPKQGFAGHCNDSLPWLQISVPQGDRQSQWRDITQAAWHKHASPGILPSIRE